MYFPEPFLSQLFLFLLESDRVIINENRLFGFYVGHLNVQYLSSECSTNGLFQEFNPLDTLVFCFCLQLVNLSLSVLEVDYQVEPLLLLHHLDTLHILQGYFVLGLSTPFIYIPEELFVDDCEIPFIPLMSSLFLLE